MIMQYIVGVIGRTWWQLSQLFAVPIVLAMALQWVGGQIRRCGAGWLGDTYWYIVSPGVACHETGHAVGCLISGCKIHEFVPFTRRYDDKLGYVTHERKRGLWGGVASFIISSGPVWFGCLMIALLSRCFGGVVRMARYGDFFANDAMPNVAEYVCGLVNAASRLLTTLFVDGTWGWGFALWFYLVFCIASEIGLSKVDLQHMWRGMAMIALAFLGFNLIPVVGKWVSAGMFVALPWFFKLHVLMLAALVLNVALLLLTRLVTWLRFH